MKKYFKLLSLILCISVICGVFAACGSGETEETSLTEGSESTESTESTQVDEDEASEESSESEQVEEETFETELVEDLVTFVDYTKSARGYFDLKAGDAAMSFTIPDGQMKKLYLNLTDKHGYVDCSIDLNIYSFTGNYRETLTTQPIYSEYITSSLRTYTVCFEDGQMPAGDYLVVLSYVEPILNEENSEVETVADMLSSSIESDETDTVSETESSSETETDVEDDVEEVVKPAPHSMVIKDNFWFVKTLPEEYEQYELRSYLKGKADKRTCFCGGFVIEHSVPVEESEENETEEPEESTPYPENTAKVILLGGQSNATGATLSSFLQKNVSEEKFAEYQAGYSNVQILYTSGTLSAGAVSERNLNTDFVPVKLGQGIGSWTYGPELGLAAYLSEAFPDETFYIIKYAIGSSGLYGHWNPLDEEKDECLVRFTEKVKMGLELLEEDGLDPRIVGFLWMQGEGDASTCYRAYEYYGLQTALAEYIRTEFGFYEAQGGIAFIDAAISESGVWASSHIVNERKRAFAKDSDMNIYIDTNAHGLTCMYENNDVAHYDSMSMILLGELYGQEIEKLLD